QVARADFDKWLGGAKPDAISALIPSDALRLHAALSEGKGNAINVTVEGKARALTVPEGLAWEPGHVGANAGKCQPTGIVELPDAGNLEMDKPFSYGAWVKLNKSTPSGAIFARMDDQHDFRGWDLWVQQNRIGAHIVSKWPTDALKVVSKQPVKVG